MSKRIKRQAITIGIIVAIVMVMILPFALPMPAYATQVAYETQTNSSTGAHLYPTQAQGQTFTTTSAHEISQVRLEMGKGSPIPGTITASLYATNGGYPTGDALASGSIEGYALPTYTGTETAIFYLDTPFDAEDATLYAIVVTHTGGEGASDLRWRWNTQNVYADGAAFKYDSPWEADGVGDRDFQIYGGYDSPIITTSLSNTFNNRSATGITINGSVSNTGGTKTVDVYVKYGTETGVYPDQTTPETLTYIGDYPLTYSLSLTGLLPKTAYYYKVVASNGEEANGESAEDEFSTLSSDGTNLVAMDTVQGAKGSSMMSHQRKMVYANGRYWIVTPSVGSSKKITYTSSVDSITWTEPALVVDRAMSSGEFMSVDTDGTYLHFAYSNYMTTSDLFYRRGLANADGTITFDTEQTATTYAASGFVKPAIILDSNGYPWIAYGKIGAEVGYITTSSTKDGTWTTPGGFPYEFPMSNNMRPSVVPMNDGKVYSINVDIQASNKALGRLWNGSSWGSTEYITSEAIPAQFQAAYSVTSYGDEVYFAYRDSSNNIKFCERVDGSWSNVETVATDLDSNVIPQLSMDTAYDVLYLLYMDTDQRYTVRYISKASGDSWSNEAEFTYCAPATHYADHYTVGNINSMRSSGKLAVYLIGGKSSFPLEMGTFTYTPPVPPVYISPVPAGVTALAQILPYVLVVIVIMLGIGLIATGATIPGLILLAVGIIIAVSGTSMITGIIAGW